MSFDLVDGVRLGRQICKNPFFDFWGPDAPSDWGTNQAATQASTFTHEGATSIKVSVGSSEWSSALYQYPPGDAADYQHDGREHTIKFGAWVWNPYSSVSSGDFRLLMRAGGYSAYSDYVSVSGADWQYLETPVITFTGSSTPFYNALSRTVTDNPGYILIFSDPKIIMDEVTIDADWRSKFSGRTIYESKETTIGQPRQLLGDLHEFTFPVDGVSSSDAALINGWHAAGHPLTLRLGSGDGNSGTVRNVALTGKKGPLTKMSGVDPLYWRGTIAAEEYR